MKRRLSRLTPLGWFFLTLFLGLGGYVVFDLVSRALMMVNHPKDSFSLYGGAGILLFLFGLFLAGLNWVVKQEKEKSK